MTVQEVMKSNVATCTSTDDMATAARLMYERHCGFVPVVDSRGAVAGVVTDRDICIAAATDKHRTPDHIPVQNVMSQPVFSCFATENLKVVLATMAKHHVRRLPVLDREGHLRGVLSIDDIVLAPRRRGAPTPDEVVSALKSIVASRSIEMIES